MFGMVMSLTIGAGLLDSLNPVAIAQQFVLQSASKNKHAILAYILGIGSTNFIFGLLFYFGLAAAIRNVFDGFVSNYANLFAGLTLSVGVLLFIYCLSKLRKKEKVVNEDQEGRMTNRNETNLSVKQLFFIGVGSCLLELTSALPYISYLTLLISLELNWVVVVFMLVLYNLILFNLPLYFLYIGSLIFEKKLLFVYRYFERVVAFLLDYVLPIVGIILSVGIVYWSIISF